MRRERPRDQPQPPWVDPSQCAHPIPVALLKFNDTDETVYRCVPCGSIMTESERGTLQKRLAIPTGRTPDE